MPADHLAPARDGQHAPACGRIELCEEARKISGSGHETGRRSERVGRVAAWNSRVGLAAASGYGRAPINKFVASGMSGVVFMSPAVRRVRLGFEPRLDLAPAPRNSQESLGRADQPAPFAENSPIGVRIYEAILISLQRPGGQDVETEATSTAARSDLCRRHGWVQQAHRRG
jgi:hypothetical protein